MRSILVRSMQVAGLGFVVALGCAHPLQAQQEGVGLIPKDRYLAHFGQPHKFHLSPNVYGKDGNFRYGGYSFGFVDEWPTNWRATEDVFVVQVDGQYFLCNRTYPGVTIPLSVTVSETSFTRSNLTRSNLTRSNRTKTSKTSRAKVGSAAVASIG